MNTQQIRLANTSHILIQQRGGYRQNTSYGIGEQLRTKKDVDLQVGESVVSVPKGTAAKVENHDSQHVLVDLGEEFGKFMIEYRHVGEYFEKVPKSESVAVPRRPVQEDGNPLALTPGAYVEVTSYDPKIGPMRGPKSPGFGGYQTLVGRKGIVATAWNINAPIMTYKVQLDHGGEFVFGASELKVIKPAGASEAAEGQKNRLQECDTTALMGLGYGL